MSTMRHELVIPGKTNALYSLETSWTKQRVVEVISYWEDAGKKSVAWELNTIDFLLVLGYCPFFFFSVRRLAQLFPNLFGSAIKFLLGMSILPGILDIIEGAFIYVWLSGSVDAISPVVVGVVSFTKFLIALPMLLLVIGGFLAALFRRNLA